MAHSLVLLKDGLVALRVFLTDVCLATEVEQILCLVQITLLTGESVEACECHLCYLMTQHNSCLTGSGSDLTAYAVGITAGDVEELVTARSLIMCACSVHHVTEIVKLVA